LVEFIFHACNFEAAQKEIQTPNQNVLNSLKALNIPYLSPPNLPFPDVFLDLFLDTPFLFGNLIRTVNSTCIDIVCKFGKSEKIALSGESKDHKTKLGTSLLKEILGKIPLGSPLHIVFVNEMLDAFTFKDSKKRKSTYEDWRVHNNKEANEGKPKNKRMVSSGLVFVKIGVTQDRQLVLKTVEGLPAEKIGDDSTCVVLFIERDIFTNISTSSKRKGSFDDTGPVDKRPNTGTTHK
jgi:hypothetical protein